MVTSRAVPWLLTMVALSACGGTTDPGGGSGGSAQVGVGGEVTGGGSTDASGCDPNYPKCVPHGGEAGDGAIGESGGSGGGSYGGGAPSGSAGYGPGGGPSQYPGSGFIVHEWGTDTIVVGSNGSLQRGLHHEEEDLPAFVYDRLKAGASIGAGNPISPSVTIKMETPVTYFYSDVPRSVRAKVSFPQGVLTQWYPGVAKFLPAIAAPEAVSPLVGPATYADPALDPAFPFQSELCRTKWSAAAGGELDWGDIAVLPRNTKQNIEMPDAPLDKFSWSYARAVNANRLQLPNGEAEQFLFYRGLGDFNLPVEVTAGKGGIVMLTNDFSKPVGTVFSINVDAERGAFNVYPQGIAAKSVLVTSSPDLSRADVLSQYQEKLAEQVTAALDATGLYHDEAVAMVNTWKRQWFRTPGARLLYVIPQLWTDSSIPLTIEPKPDALLRVMLIRVEVITPEQEADDLQALTQLEASVPAARTHFAALGRFAEPRLRRALAQRPSPLGEAYLAEIRGANTAVASE